MHHPRVSESTRSAIKRAREQAAIVHARTQRLRASHGLRLHSHTFRLPECCPCLRILQYIREQALSAAHRNAPPLELPPVPAAVCELVADNVAPSLQHRIGPHGMFLVATALFAGLSVWIERARRRDNTRIESLQTAVRELKETLACGSDGGKTFDAHGAALAQAGEPLLRRMQKLDTSTAPAEEIANGLESIRNEILPRRHSAESFDPEDPLYGQAGLETWPQSDVCEDGYSDSED